MTIFDISNVALYYFNETVGPTVTMTEVKEPEAIEYEQTSTQNGEILNITWTVTTLSYLKPGDKFAITVPSPMRYTVTSKMIGSGYWINGDLDSTISFDSRTITGTVAINTQSRRNL